MSKVDEVNEMAARLGTKNINYDAATATVFERDYFTAVNKIFALTPKERDDSYVTEFKDKLNKETLRNYVRAVVQMLTDTVMRGKVSDPIEMAEIALIMIMITGFVLEDK